MARNLRVEYPGAIYHPLPSSVAALRRLDESFRGDKRDERGDQRKLIIKDDADYQRFIETLGEACAKTGWQVHAYVLMPNHFHVVVETPQPNLVAGMKWFPPRKEVVEN